MPNVTDNPVSENRQSPPPETEAQAYLRRHAVDFAVAAEAGVRSDGLNLYWPYEAPNGTKYERVRNLVDGICRQPAGRPLDLFWALGKSNRTPILLCEGEADTLAAASILANTEHPILTGLCPVGLPGASAPAARMAQGLMEAKCGYVYICLDGDEAGRQATKRMVLALERVHKRGIPIELPEGKDLSDCLVGLNPQEREDWLANLLADHEANGNVDQLVADDVKRRLAA